MGIATSTPTETPFEFDIDVAQQRIVITTNAGNQHAYQLRSLHDLYLWLKNDREGEWVLLGTKREDEPTNPDTVEEWARSQQNPVEGFYGVTPGRRGQFASYIPSVLECLGFVEITHHPKNNEVRAWPVQ